MYQRAADMKACSDKADCGFAPGWPVLLRPDPWHRPKAYLLPSRLRSAIDVSRTVTTDVALTFDGLHLAAEHQQRPFGELEQREQRHRGQRHEQNAHRQFTQR